MKASKRNAAKLTYAQTGIDRKIRKRSQVGIQDVLAESAAGYRNGKPLVLPFGRIFPASKSASCYYDLQIEGVGTKILLAELVGKYDTIGIDAVAMAVNDVLRSGADPLLMSDALHINRSEPSTVASILSGIRTGAELAGCAIASGETGDVGEILHNPISSVASPFDLFVSCLGIVTAHGVIKGYIGKGDRIIGLPSSGIHSNGLTLARRVLLKTWGGRYDVHDRPEILGRPVIEELLEPTRIFVKAFQELNRDGIEIKAAIHITGDGLAKFRRLLDFQKSPSLGARIVIPKEPPIFKLIESTARESGTPISRREMLRTFNMGIGFAVVVEPKSAKPAIDSLNKQCKAEDIGFVSIDGKVSVQMSSTEKTVIA